MLRVDGTGTIIGAVPFGVKIELHGAGFRSISPPPGALLGAPTPRSL
jgi:hypothetical protein